MAVASGAALGQVVLLAVTPIVTRMFGPETFGIWGILNAVVGILAPIATAGYITAIVLPVAEVKARALAVLSFIIALTVSVLCTLVFLIVGPAFGLMLGLGDQWGLLLWVGVLVLAIATADIARQQLVRASRFRAVAIAHTGTATFVAIAQVVGGLLSASPLSLTLANLSGRVLDAASKVWMLLHSGVRFSKVPGLTPSTVWAVAREYKHFPRYRAPQVLVDGISQALPVILLAALYGPAVAGFYTLVRSVLLVGGNVIGTAVGDVFLPRLARAFHGGEGIAPLVRRATLAVAGAGFLPFLFVCLSGPTLFGWVFGEEWAEAGAYAQWIAFWIWLIISNRPALQAVQVLSLQRFHLTFTVVNAVVRLGGLVAVAAAGLSPVHAVAVFSVLGMLSNLLLIAIVMVGAGRHDRRT